MADRVTPESRLGGGSLRPTASPRDTFVRPEKPSSLIALAESLGKISNAAGDVATAVRAKRLEAEEEQGAGDAATAIQGGKNFRQAIQDGSINPAGSAAYRKAAKKQFAQLSAFSYGSALNSFMTEQLADETDLDSFNSRVDEFSRQWVEQNADPEDAEFLRDFQRQAAAIRQNAVTQMSWRVGERMRQQTEEQFGQLVGAAVTAEYNWTEPAGRGERVIGAVNALRQRAFDMGIRGARVNQLIFESVSSLAIADGKPELLKAVADVPTGPNGSVTLKDIPEFREKIARARHAAEAAANRQELGESSERVAEANAVLQEMQNELIMALDNGLNPSSVNINTFKRRMNEINPAKVAQLESARQSFIAGYNRQTLPAIEQDIVEQIYAPEQPFGLNDLHDAFERGGLNTSTYLKLRRLIESRDRVNTTRSVRPDQMMGEALRIIGERLDARGLDSEDARIMKGRVRSQFRQQAYTWLASEEGQGSTQQQIRDHFRLIAETLSEPRSRP